MIYDVVIAGGGPAGLSAALALGRARRRVLLCDAGAPRNAAASQLHNFVTRDGTPPAEFRRIGRAQLEAYPSVTTREVRIDAITGEPGAYVVDLGGETVRARRVILCVGMIDEVPDRPGFRAHWGRSIVQCPYCHGWEVQERRFGYLVPAAAWLEWALFLRGWSREVTAFTDGRFEVPADVRSRLTTGGVMIEERAIRGLVGEGSLEAVELVDGARVPCEVLFARPPQRQTPLVTGLGLELDEHGLVKVNERMESSRPGIFAAGDLATMAQGAILAAAAGTQAAAALNHGLIVELALAGALE